MSDITKTPKLYLAPMAGVTDSAFRQVCRSLGADYVVGEMISAKALTYGDKKTALLAAFMDCERPVILQIFGNDHGIMAEGAKILCENFSPDGIDINMGCPVPKITKNGEGSALLDKPELIEKIVRAVKSAVDVPVSVKLRLGRTPSKLLAIAAALAAKSAGADFICVHGRFASQMYAPPVYPELIREVKTALGEDYPLIANGDVVDAESALRLAGITGCDRLMIGRASLGRPWIFGEIKAAFAGEKFTCPDIGETMALHARLAFESKPEKVAVNELRKHIAAYVKGFKGAAALRDRVNRTETKEELFALIDGISRMF
ncbi:MAG: tRNA-dihydrouridine synthase [Clostridia bacterium]|nr:tRNA-dihydrouridine synthase [Clostridia bacterium]